MKKPQQQPASKIPATKTKTIMQHLCLDRAYGSKAVEQEIIRRGYAYHSHIREKVKRSKTKDRDKAFEKKYHPRKRLVVEDKLMAQQIRKLFIRLKKRQRTTLVWFSYHAASSSMERPFWD